MTPTRSTVAHTFWFSPGRTDTIRLAEVKTGCACIRVDSNRTAALAGDSLPVTIRWTPKTETDSVQTAYAFFAGNPDPIHLVLAREAQSSAPSLTAVPQTVEFPTAKGARKESAGIRVTNLTENELDLKVVSAPTDIVSIRTPDRLEKAKPTLVEIVLANPNDTTWFERSVTLEASDPSAKKSYRLTVPVRRGATVVPATTMTRQ